MGKFIPELPVVSTWHQIGVDVFGPFHHLSREGNTVNTYRLSATISANMLKHFHAKPIRL